MTPVWHFVNGVPNTGPMVIGPLSIGPTAVASTVPYVGPVGSDSATTFNFGTAGTGIFSSGADQIAFSLSGSRAVTLLSTGLWLSNYNVVSGGVLGFANGGVNSAIDASLSRGAAGRVDTTKAFRMTPVAFAALPTAAEGAIASVNDSNTATWGASIAGGGANKVLAYYNGTAWKVAGA